jgi:hypothetical protein
MLFATWPWRRPRVGLAFAHRFLLGRRAGEQALTVRRELPPGLVAPSVSTPNIQSVTDVAKLATEILDELSARRLPVSLVLPDLAVVTSFSPASDGGGRSVESRLGFPQEARRDFWRGRKGEMLGAAVKETVVRQYEQVVEAAECEVSWIDCASLVRIPVWTEGSLVEPHLSVRVQLHPSHYFLVAFRAGELVDVRRRLRAPEDPSSVADEILRGPVIYGVDRLGSVTLSGEGALVCAGILETARVTDVSVVEESEESQLVAALDELLRRG